MWRWIKMMLRRWRYRHLLRDKRWVKLRWKIVRMDAYRCVGCGATEHLQVHHVRYRSGSKPWEYDEDDLVTLCRACHAHAHGRER